MLALGENLFQAVELLDLRRLRPGMEAIGYTLFYATNFIFTGLAVAIAFFSLRPVQHRRRGWWAYVAGLGVTLVGLYLGFLLHHRACSRSRSRSLPRSAASGPSSRAGCRRGAAATSDHHLIMFNFIAAALMTYMVVNVLIRPGSQIPESGRYADSALFPKIHEMLAAFGIEISSSPLNLAFVIALICCVAFYVFVWKTKWGYAIRVTGANENAAVYGGISPAQQIMIAMTISGALAGGVALNELLGSQHRLILNFPSGYGFVGIAVALMGRNHPIGIILASLLFGALYQGGSELSFDMPTISRDIVVVIQGLVILFAGALEHMFRPSLEALFARPERAEATA
ncbi:MAG: ABC transporter permease [Alphaproteobacteria bacterium]